MGCLYWFMYAKLNWAVSAKRSADDTFAPETRFYNGHRDLFNKGDTIADVAVLRGRDTNINGPTEAISNAYLFEQAMITEHIPFEIIFDQHLDDLSKYRAVTLPDVRMMKDEQIRKLLDYVENGGDLVVTDQTASQDQWGRPRNNGISRFLSTPVSGSGEILEQRGRGRIVYTRIARPPEFSKGSLPSNGKELGEAVAQAMGGDPTFRTDAPPYVGMEFVRQRRRILIHMVDYSETATAQSIRIRVSPTLGKVTGARLLSPRREEIELEVKSRAAGIEMTVPGLDAYAVVVATVE